jgi:hypothetical protein
MEGVVTTESIKLRHAFVDLYKTSLDTYKFTPRKDLISTQKLRIRMLNDHNRIRMLNDHNTIKSTHIFPYQSHSAINKNYDEHEKPNMFTAQNT